jgi:FemAB-related protein (PEP-CTERM system-associated)
MKVELSLPAAGWSSALESQARGTFYLLPEWLELISRVYGYPLLPLTTRNETGLVTGFLPLLLVQNRFTGRRLVSLPFSDYCPLLAENPACARELIDQALHLAHERRMDCLELRTGVHALLAERADFVAGELYVRWVLPLGADAQALWSQLRKPVQRQVRKAENLGVRVRVAQRREEMLEYYALHLRTRCRKHGMPAQPRRFFLELWDTFASRGHLKLLLAEYEGQTIGGMVLLAAGETMRYAYGASHERYLQLAPNNLLMWTAISQACSEGYRLLDMGRTATDNPGLMEFKRRWGSVREPLPYYYYPRRAGPASTSESSLKYRLLTAGWKRLPLRVSGPLGGYLYRYLG